jgi:hypothetical protein
VAACITAYEDRHGDRLHSVYVRGSAVLGGFVPGVSDLDTWALVRDDAIDGPRVHVDGYDPEAIVARFPDATEVELCHTGLVRLQQPDAAFGRMLLATTAACVHGTDLIPTLPRVRPGVDTLGHCLHVASSVQDLLASPLDGTDDDVAAATTWIGKAVVRAGLEAHAHEHGQYTRDLWPCYALFSAFHPDRAEAMRAVLEATVDPSPHLDDLRALLRRVQDELLDVLVAPEG